MTLHIKLLAALFLIWAAGVALAQQGHPVLYCYVWEPVLWRPLLQPYASLALMVCAFYFLWALATSGLMSGKSFAALGMMFLIGNLDGWARTLLALGKSCG